MKREIEKKLKDLISANNQNNVIIIEGARQVGKSYLVNRILESQDMPYVSFDLEKDPKARKAINRTEDFNDFRTLMEDQYGIRKNSILFFDEAQDDLGTTVHPLGTLLYNLTFYANAGKQA